MLIQSPTERFKLLTCILFISHFKTIIYRSAEVFTFVSHIMLTPALIRLLVFVAEFESWYNESFLLPEEVLSIFKDEGPIRPGLVPVDKALALVSNNANITKR